jgi:hypothetical protein
MRGSGENWNAESGLANMQMAKNIAVFVERHFRTWGCRWKADVSRVGRPRKLELKVSDPKRPVVRRQ